MPVPQVSIQNGNVTNGPLTSACQFQWSNPTATPVQLTNCGGFCTQANYYVPAHGTAAAQLLPAPTSYTFSETPNEWNAPGQPRITAPTRPAAHDNKEVA